MVSPTVTTSISMVASWAKGKFFLMWWHDSLGRTCDYSKSLDSVIIYVPNFPVLLTGLWGNWWLTRERRCSLNSLLPCDMEHGFCLTILYCCTLTLNCHDKLSRNQVPLYAVTRLLLLTSNNLGFCKMTHSKQPS